MKKVSVSIQNRFFSESVLLMLRRSGDLCPVSVPSAPPDVVLSECESEKPNILLMDVASAPSESRLEERLELAKKLRERLPSCKIALLCDETAYPELARDVMRAKQEGKIDAFFYASVTTEYLIASLNAL
ncbi:MAG: hypothetical protein ACI4IT_02095 [Oscillospiraceae bacterium]